MSSFVEIDYVMFYKINNLVLKIYI
jgi:hypothetical protein